MRKLIIAVLTALSMLLATSAVASTAAITDEVRTELQQVKKATKPYHHLGKALRDGFAAFSLEGTDMPTCFESPNGGMGVHYVRNIDGVVDATDPEAMVYEVGKNGKLKLVAVEYIVPQEFVEDADGNVVNLPSLFGHDFHKHSFLPVYILHAWIWKVNPDGMFADFNPNVRPCPASQDGTIPTTLALFCGIVSEVR